MSLAHRLHQAFQVESTLEACQRLVERTFPDCANAYKRRDVLALAKRAGISVIADRVEQFDGMLEMGVPGRPRITLTTSGGRLRTRFTLAHELGHWLLRGAGSESPDVVFRGSSDVSDREEETIANLLAAELLMPARFIANALRSATVGLGLLRDLSRRLEVSFQAALRRVADVSNVGMLYVNAVPHRFRDITTIAEIDEALYVRPLAGIFYDREHTRFLAKRPFCDIQRSRIIRLGLEGSHGMYSAEFEVRANNRPFPNCDLLAVLRGGELHRGAS
jgi:Zn-dependent peptidase ImmA (M78 family)